MGHHTHGPPEFLNAENVIPERQLRWKSMPGVLSGHRSASKLANGIRVLKKELFAIKKVSQVARPQVVSAGLCGGYEFHSFRL